MAPLIRRWLYVVASLAVVSLFLNLKLYLYSPQRSLDFTRNKLRQDVFSKSPGPQEWTEKTWQLDLPALRRVVAGTNGYYTRDWSVGLGWNNLRYIIETSLLHAKLLNRVLVLPSFVYARNCEFSIEVCSQYGLFVDRTEAIGWNAWDGAPLSTLAWKLPMQVMLDVPHLRETHPVVLASEFFELHELDPSLESLAGDWNTGLYETNVTFPTIHVIPSGEYDPSDVVRVDTLRGVPVIGQKDGAVDEILKAALDDKLVLQWDEAIGALRTAGWQLETDNEIERVINSGDWIVTHTFLGAGGMDYIKTVVDPIRQATPRSRLRGFVEDYYQIKAEILYLEGEIHLSRKPGGLRFTTEKGRDAFTNLVLFGFRSIQPVRALAKTLAERMAARCDGRMWMSAHMRRGDFVAVGWSMEKTVEGHLSRVRDRLKKGREVLRQITSPKAYNIIGVKPDLSLSSLDPPLENDPFLLATDERDAQSLEYLRNNSAVLIYDLLTIEDRRSFGWMLLFTDVLALIEQNLLVHSSYFYGHALSSFAGGVLNMRAARGANPETILID